MAMTTSFGELNSRLRIGDLGLRQGLAVSFRWAGDRERRTPSPRLGAVAHRVSFEVSRLFCHPAWTMRVASMQSSLAFG